LGGLIVDRVDLPDGLRANQQIAEKSGLPDSAAEPRGIAILKICSAKTPDCRIRVTAFKH